jgi:hypothetical protein
VVDEIPAKKQTINLLVDQFSVLSTVDTHLSAKDEEIAEKVNSE